MKTKLIIIPLTTALLISFSSMGVLAERPLTFSCSSQIAEAFGKEVIQEFEEKRKIKVDLFVGSSEIALQRLANQFSELACIAFRLPNSYRDKGYVEIPFARDHLTLTVGKQCSIQSLSLNQIRQVFSGNIKNWQVLGGKEQRIIKIIPSSKTAANKNFSRQVMQGFDLSSQFSSKLSTDVLLAVKHIPGSISFISLGSAVKEKGIKSIEIDGTAPGDKDYPLTQVFSFVTRGKPRGNAKEFINAAFSSRGQEIIKDKCMCPLLENMQESKEE